MNAQNYEILKEKTKLEITRVILCQSHLRRPLEFAESVPLAYVGTFIIPKKEIKKIAKINESIDAAIDIAAPTLFNDIINDTSCIRRPLRDGDNPLIKDSIYKDAYYLRASSQRRIPILNQKNKDRTGFDEDFERHYCKIGVEFYAYKVGEKVGVGCKLRSIKLYSERYYKWRK